VRDHVDATHERLISDEKVIAPFSLCACRAWHLIRKRVVKDSLRAEVVVGEKVCLREPERVVWITWESKVNLAPPEGADRCYVLVQLKTLSPQKIAVS